ncbi:hypothetical protein LshimejAT787_0202990 [Lyophyllum shimeji]|uniref:Uncharacterized protein n=1 Tax=Lyophyllum shimeji TaxID=47721 RepID=A0A9P3UI03_LYOSH|nr:hypothetical protein LshimejAT787_0202990 [Lyophyllum shimeji]
MFEEMCLVCGKHLDDDALAYCSEDCQSQDTSESPSISSASSAVSSPNLGYATGGDVPPLVPSALGSALSKYARGRHHYSVSSSSASSTSWSVATDDEDDGSLGVSSYGVSRWHESEDSLYEGSSKSANFVDSMKPSPSALSYARRPSGTNNRSTVPNPHGRASAHVPEVPHSSPLHSHLSTDDDAGYSDVGFSSRDESESEFHVTKPVSPPKSKRNRASLPAYFSLLQMSNLSDGKRISPVSTSSGNTIARRSPPTPKLSLAGLTHSSSTIPSIASHTTPRGRRRVQGESRGSRCSGDSSSRSHSRSRRALPSFSQEALYSQESQTDDEGFTDWSSAPGLSRGRPPVRRNSSPPPKMMLSTDALEDHNRALAAASRAEGALPSGFRKTRGRFKPEADVDAPGFGCGRSGLLARERGLGHRTGRVL